MKSFPHEFSGGQRQRVVTALAIANNPDVIIADEPTTALDVTIQAQILELLKTAQQETHAATLMITHDMGVVASTADEVIVMYAGRAVEQADVHTIFQQPRMPYTIGLLGSIPSAAEKSTGALTTIAGSPPIAIDLPQACAFAPRCPVATEECHASAPTLTPLVDAGSQVTGNTTDSGTADPGAGTTGAGAHTVACHRATEIVDRAIDGNPLFPRATLSETPSAAQRAQRPTVLEVRDLQKSYPLTQGALLKRRVGTVHAVRDISFEIKEGECFAIVGESGCGKTSALLEIMELQPDAPTSIALDGTDVQGLSKRERRLLRKDIQIVFQDPMGALDPRMTVAEIIREPLHSFGWEGDHNERIRELMELCGLNPAHMDRFPSHFSGGQRQRIAIARALATNPKLLVLDEPVSALDVSIQAGILNLLDELKQRLHLSYLFVAHDLSVIRHISDRGAVMYLGSFVEQGDTEELFSNPQHPYTQALLSAIPVPDPEHARNHNRIMLRGSLPAASAEISGCPFHTRCPRYQQLDAAQRERCDTSQPDSERLATADHLVSCHFATWKEQS